MRGAPNINLAWTMLAAEECFRLGVRHAVVSPGSRSAPLAVAFARHGGIAVHVAHDERGGAFLALGVGKSTGVPAVHVTTSGTAVANTLPAVVEARMTRAPLLVFAADRPPELRDCGANQAIPQANLLAGAARWSVDMPAPSTEAPAEFVLSTVDEAFARATGAAGAQGGAVHLNWQFREPLAPDVAPWDGGWLWSVSRWIEDGARRPWRETVPPVPTVLEVEAPLVVAGAMPAAARASLAGWKGTVVADITSSLAGTGTAGADLVLRAAFEDDGIPALVAALRTDAILAVGDAVVSKRLGAWIARQSCAVTAIGGGDPRVDAAHRVRTAYAGPVRLVAGKGLRPHRGWARALSVATRAAARAIRAEGPLCEPTAIAEATAACAKHPEGTIFYGSSMPVRDADFLAIHPPDGWEAAANRGASGIDGLVASAAGHAVAGGAPVVAFVGDVSALHDLPSLGLLGAVRSPLVLVVLNNDGGGIFRYLPIARHDDVFERLFTTPHGLEIAPIARAFGLAVESPATRRSLARAVAKALTRDRATVIEVRCAREASEACRARVAKAAVDALAREFRG
ncbi:MAG: 2-succinyl-5-enolpyruvyl-6-hydroxy-3-cyclohexene-1-carboxylic-acid synthase [Phycisphaera sp.]|nr:2-succinyl-5-enolpyruvyl-6-hydroxy-3-cyclohexene-1-carboxylic-acid synthase [Phycisphaera sp.]